jgi:hypothetical protein
MEKHSRTEVGYASVIDIDYDRKAESEDIEDRDPYGHSLSGQPRVEDSMPRFVFSPRESSLPTDSLLVMPWLRHLNTFISA